MFNTYSSTITSKGQATIPAPIRKKLNIEPGEKLIFESNGQMIYIKTHTQLVNELAGSLKPKIKVKYTDRKANKVIGEYLAREYLKKYGQAS